MLLLGIIKNGINKNDSSMSRVQTLCYISNILVSFSAVFKESGLMHIHGEEFYTWPDREKDVNVHS